MFIPAFLSEKPIYAGLSTTILFPTELFLSNTTTFIKSLEIDFGDKIKRNFVFGETHNITFASAGTKTIRIVAKLSDGTEKAILTYLKVVDASALRTIPPVPPCWTQTFNATIPFAPYEPEPLSNVNGHLEAGYYTANGKNCSGPVTKPIIILDGFDAGDERKIGDIYGDKLAYNGVNNNFGEELRAQGYDVIIVNFPKYLVGTIPFSSFNFPVYRDGGADYVERNAMAVVALIQDINFNLRAWGNPEQLTIVGPSMGGLISRYALAYMEKQALLNPTNVNWDHNTRLWISFDSPHNGATIPIGSQKMLQKVGDIVSSAKEILDESLGNPAAKQMLLMHYTSPINKESWYRNVFKATMSNNGLAGSDGFPKNLRKIALINGQLQGIEKYAGATGDYMNIRLKKRFWTYFPIPIGIILPGAELFTYFAPANNNVGMVHKTQLYFFGFIGLQGGSTNANAYDAFGSIDKTPGGYFNSSQKVLSGFIDEGIPGVLKIEGSVSYPNICFIPSKSGLAYTGTNTNFFQNLSGTNLLCNGETPFDNYFAPNTDEDHVTISAASASWLFAELNRVPQYTMPLPTTNFNIIITADPNNINCRYQQQTFSIDMTNVVSVSWTTTGNWGVVPGSAIGGSVRIFTNTNGVGTLRAETTMKNFCLGNGIGYKRVEIAKPVDYIITIVPLTNNLICPEPIISGVLSTRRYSLVYTLPPGTGAPLGLPYITGSVRLLSQTATEFEVEFLGNGPVSINVDNYHPTSGSCAGANRGTGTFSGAVGPPIVLSSETDFIGDCDLSTTTTVFGDGVTSITVDGITTPSTGSITLNVVGTYAVSATNACGTGATYYIVVPPNLINCNKTVVQAPKSPEITISPNPANTYLDVANILAGSEVKIYTKMGVLVHHQQSENDRMRLDISKLSTDLYILEAILPDKVKVRKQIIKE